MKGNGFAGGASIVIVTGAILIAAYTLDAAERATTRPARAAAASRPVFADLEESEIARRMADDGDPRIIPVALHWLACEQDGQPIGYGTPRLRAAIYAVQTLEAREAVTLLRSAYDSPNALGEARSLLAKAAIRLDPANLDFCREVLGDDISLYRAKDNSAVAAAAATLVASGDTSAADILIHGYTEFIEALQAGDKVNTSFHLEMNRLTDLKLRRLLMGMRAKYKTEPAFNQLGIDAELIRVNAMSLEERMKMALDAAAKESDRYLALLSIGNLAGPEVLAALEKAEPWSPGFTPATRPAATRPAVAASRPAAIAPQAARPKAGTTEWAIAQIRKRSRRGHSFETPPPLNGLTAVAPLAPDEQVMRLSSLLVGPDLKPSPRPVVLWDVNGQGEFHAGASYEMVRHILTMPPDATVRLKIDPKPYDVLECEPIATRPGEASPNGYILVERRTIHDAGGDRLAVVLRKFTRETIARVPNRNKAGGGVGPDSRLARAIDALKPGDVVEARLEHRDGPEPIMLSEISPYRASLSAKFVRWIDDPSGEAAVELSVGREKKVYLLPEPREAVPVPVSPEIRGRFWPGATVRIQVEEGAAKAPPRLRDFDVTGFVEFRDQGARVVVHSETATMQGDPRIAPFHGKIMVFGKGGDLTRAEVGLRNLLAGKVILPGEFSPAAREQLTNVIKARDTASESSRTAQLNQVFERYQTSADRSARRSAEQEMYLLLQHETAEMYDKQQKIREEIMGILTKAQYRALLESGRHSAAAENPATRPATQPSMRPERAVPGRP